jgi:hypothetical protein
MDARIVKVWSDVIASGEKITAKLVNDAVDKELGIEKKTADAGNADADGQAADAGTAGQAATDEPSGSAELRAMVRELKRKVAYLESALDAEKQAHKRTAATGGVPQSAMAKKLFKAGYRAMAKTAHPDHGGTADDMAELNNLKDALNI